MASQSYASWNDLGSLNQTGNSGPWTVASSDTTTTRTLSDQRDRSDIGERAADAPIIATGTFFGDTYVLSESNLDDQQVELADSSLDFTVCFAAGTRIATQNGEKPIHSLRAGDRVMKADGTETTVLWLGRQTMHKLFHGPQMRLVRIHAGVSGRDRTQERQSGPDDRLAGHGTTIDGGPGRRICQQLGT